MEKDDDLLRESILADDRGQVAYARYLCELYLRDHPDDPATLIRYASSLISLAQYPKARKALDHAESIVPKRFLQLVLAERGHLLEAEGDFLGASEMFMKSHSLSPIDATYLIFAGSAAFRRGNVHLAQTLARQATECAKGCIDEAWFNLGGYLLSDGKFRESAECYRRALEIDPDYEIAKERLADVELILRSEWD
jgi:tetratricopeptide (TPR) repeat protein